MESNRTITLSEIAQGVSLSRTYLMGMGMLMVVMFHCDYGILFRYFGYWGVDVFLFVSGFGIWFSLSKGGVLGFYSRRLLRVMPAALLCGVVFGVLGCANGEGALAFCGLNLWYIRTILIFYLLSPGVFFCMKRWGWMALLLMISVAEIMAILFDGSIIYMGTCLTSTMSWSCSRLPVYLLGMYLAFCSDCKSAPIRRAWLAVVCVGAVILLGFLRWWQMGHHLGYVKSLFMPSFLLAPAIGVSGVLFARWKDYVPVWALKIIYFLGMCSLEIYLIHEALLKYSPNLVTIVHSRIAAKFACILLSFFLAWILNMVSVRLQACIRKKYSDGRPSGVWQEPVLRVHGRANH